MKGSGDQPDARDAQYTEAVHLLASSSTEQYRAGYQILQALAREGHIDARARLGHLLDDDGANLQEVLRLLRAAAEQDHPQALARLADVYPDELETRRTPRTQAEARLAAAAHGSVEPMTAQGSLHVRQGEVDEGWTWFRRAVATEPERGRNHVADHVTEHPDLLARWWAESIEAVIERPC